MADLILLYGTRFLLYNRLIFFLMSLTPVLVLNVNAYAIQQKNILVFGDSLVQGYGLPESQGFVHQLQELVAKGNPDIKLINGGVSGDTTSGGLSRLEWALAPDIHGIVLSLGANDMLRGIPPELSKLNLEKMLFEFEKKQLPVLLVGIEAIENFGQTYKNNFDNIYPALARSFDILYYPNFLSGILRFPETEVLNYLQADNIHPNEKGVALIVEDILPFIQSLVEELNDE